MTRAEMAKYYEAGHTFAEVAAHTPFSEETARRMLKGLVDSRPSCRRVTSQPKPHGPWEARVVDRLCELKSLGSVDFDYAWQVAIRENPSRLRDQARPTGQLFDETGHGDESVVEFFERVCGDAWHGRGSDRLRGFSVSMLAGSFVEMDEVA